MQQTALPLKKNSNAQIKEYELDPEIYHLDCMSRSSLRNPFSKQPYHTAKRKRTPPKFAQCKSSVRKINSSLGESNTTQWLGHMGNETIQYPISHISHTTKNIRMRKFAIWNGKTRELLFCLHHRPHFHLFLVFVNHVLPYETGQWGKKWTRDRRDDG